MSFAASRFEYRFRWGLHALIFVIGFVGPLLWFGSLHTSRESTWLVLTGEIASAHWMSFQAATVLLLAFATVCAALAAFLRTWGTAYLSASVVHSTAMHDQGVIGDGPFRYTRNPLYLGTFLFALALALLMPPTGALFAVACIGLFQLRLIFAEEPFLLAKLGEPYAAYCARVPRILPAPASGVLPSGRSPRWGQAVLGETMMVGVAGCYAVVLVAVLFPQLDWPYSAWILTRCVIVCLGVSLVVRALLPRAPAA